jgi:DnaJ-class molecular chaperone
MTLVEDEYWYKCKDCDGTGTVNVPVGLDVSMVVGSECPGCGGTGVIQGDEDDEEHGWVRVPN